MSTAQKSSTREENIKKRAYLIWENEGRPEGKHLDHWRQAANEAPDAREAQVARSTKRRPSKSTK